MPFLAINGIALPVRADSVRVEPLEIGERGRKFDGSPWSSVRARKRRWSLETPPMAQIEAAAWRELFAGVGHTADFEADTWTAQGINGALAGTAARSAAQKWAGAYSLYAPAGTGNYCQWALSHTTWTAAVRMSTGASFYHCLFRSDLASGYYYGGAFQAVAPGWFEWSSGPRLAADVSVARYFDDLLVLPFAVPASWVPQMAAHTRALPALPRLEASGDMVGSPVVVTARYGGSRTVAGMSGGALAHTLEQLSVELEEA